MFSVGVSIAYLSFTYGCEFDGHMVGRKASGNKRGAGCGDLRPYKFKKVIELISKQKRQS